jgi:ABC-type proline/glycine betaine transport system ATPase subunit
MQTQVYIGMEELLTALEPLIRRVVQEELENVVRKKKQIFYVEPDMPIYEDMKDIGKRKKQGKIKLYSHKEVWGE